MVNTKAVAIKCHILTSLGLSSAFDIIDYKILISHFKVQIAIEVLTEIELHATEVKHFHKLPHTSSTLCTGHGVPRGSVVEPTLFISSMLFISHSFNNFNLASHQYEEASEGF